MFSNGAMMHLEQLSLTYVHIKVVQFGREGHFGHFEVKMTVEIWILKAEDGQNSNNILFYAF